MDSVHFLGFECHPMLLGQAGLVANVFGFRPSLFRNAPCPYEHVPCLALGANTGCRLRYAFFVWMVVVSLGIFFIRSYQDKAQKASILIFGY